MIGGIRKLSKLIQHSPVRPQSIFGFGAKGVNSTTTQSGLHDYRSHFHQLLTDDWDYQIPNRSLWYVVLNNPGIPKAIDTASLRHFETGNMVSGRGPSSTDDSWDIDKSRNILDKGKVGLGEGHPSGVVGCTFAQGVNIPAETLSTTRLSVPNRGGYISGLISGERNDFNPLSIEFRETNTSFLDVIIRPWIILASHEGFIARPPDDDRNIKCNIDIYYLGVIRSGVQSAQRKKFTFYNCVPYQMTQQQSTYDTDAGTVDAIDTQWAYTHYTVDVLTRNSETGGHEEDQWDFVETVPGQALGPLNQRADGGFDPSALA